MTQFLAYNEPDRIIIPLHSTNKKNQLRWTEEERDKLRSLVDQNLSSDGRICWEEISKSFEFRTKLQLKSYYFNTLLGRQFKDISFTQKREPKKQQQKPPKAVPKVAPKVDHKPVTLQTEQAAPQQDTQNGSDSDSTVAQQAAEFVNKQRFIGAMSNSELFMVYSACCTLKPGFLKFFPYDDQEEVMDAYSRVHVFKNQFKGCIIGLKEQVDHLFRFDEELLEQFGCTVDYVVEGEQMLKYLINKCDTTQDIKQYCLTVLARLVGTAHFVRPGIDHVLSALRELRSAVYCE